MVIVLIGVYLCMCACVRKSALKNMAAFLQFVRLPGRLTPILCLLYDGGSEAEGNGDIGIHLYNLSTLPPLASNPGRLLRCLTTRVRLFTRMRP